MTRNTLTPTLFLALVLALVVPVGAQESELGAATDASVLSTLHDLSTGQLVLLEGDVRDVVALETTADHLEFDTRHRAVYLELELTDGRVVRLRCSGPEWSGCPTLEREDTIFVVAQLASGRSGFDRTATSFSLVSFVRK